MGHWFTDVLAACGVLALIITIPGTIEIFLLTIGAANTRRRDRKAEGADPRLAVVIPAHNEAALIGRCVASVFDSARLARWCEVVVVADNCTDETASLAAEAGARVLIRHNAELRGKGYALRHAFDELRPEHFDAFLIVDADSILSPNLISAVKRYLSSGSRAVQCRYRIANQTASLRARLMDLAFLAFNVMRPRGRSGLGLSAGILGNGFALRTDLLHKVPWDASSIVEDLEYHLRLIAAGERVDFVNEATVFGETPAGGQSARVQRSRWEGGRLRMAKEWGPKLAREIARGTWRLTEPLLDLLTLPLAYQVLLLSFSSLVLPQPLRGYSFGALALLLVHVLWSSSLGGQPLKTAAALAAAPFYIIWKITTLASVFAASRRDAGWVRTSRDAQKL